MGFTADKEVIDLSTVTLKVETSSKISKLQLNVSAPSYFELVLNSEFASDMQAPLFADLRFEMLDIKWLEKFEPAFAGTHGKFKLNLQATGNRLQPKVAGNFALQNGTIRILPTGLKLQQLEGNIFSEDASSLVKLDAFVSSQEKRISVAGNISLDEEEDYPYLLTINGTDFPIVRTADVTMDISPELTVNGNTELHRIRGKLTIPLLDVLFSSLPESAVAVSPDVVIIQSKKPGAVHIEDNSETSEFVKDHLDIDVAIILQPDIHIRGFGLDTRLSGEINMNKAAGVAKPLADGQVVLSEGSYKAYGQNLVIEQGRILFAGPVDNPAINVRAYRPNLPVKAGVNVTGNIRQPKLILFSEPSQTESDTLSYIITGRPLTSASGGEASLIAQAALTLGAQESSMLTGQIGEMFNLDEFSVGAGDTVESTSVNASKKLSKDLTFRTAFNPFDEMWTFLLNYRLTDNWSVQTESGVSQGVDLIYSVESSKFKDLYLKILELFKF